MAYVSFAIPEYYKESLGHGELQSKLSSIHLCAIFNLPCYL